MFSASMLHTNVAITLRVMSPMETIFINLARLATSPWPPFAKEQLHVMLNWAMDEMLTFNGKPQATASYASLRQLTAANQ